MTLNELRHQIDCLIEAHGGDSDIVFRHAYASGRTTVSHITSCEVFGMNRATKGHVRFNLNHPRGEVVAQEPCPNVGGGDNG